MTTIAILPVPSPEGALTYRALAGARQSAGQTAGEALDAISKQLSPNELGTLVIVQHHRPDEFFTADQQKRLEDLMNQWREARDAGAELPDAERNELAALVDAELQAAAQRANAIAHQLGS